MAAINWAWFRSPIDNRLRAGVRASELSSSSEVTESLLRVRKTFGRTYEILYPLTIICPVYCTSTGGIRSSNWCSWLRFDDVLASVRERLKADEKVSGDLAGSLRERAAFFNNGDTAEEKL